MFVYGKYVSVMFLEKSDGEKNHKSRQEQSSLASYSSVYL